MRRALAALARRTSLENPAVPLTGGRLLSSITDPGELWHGETSLQGPTSVGAALRCVQLIADGVAGCPLRTFNPTTRELVDIPALSSARVGMTPYERHEMTVAHQALWGNAYWRKHFTPDGRLAELTPIHPARVVPEIVDGPDAAAVGMPWVKRFMVDTRFPFTERDILHLPGFSLDGVSGISVIERQRRLFQLAEHGEEMADRFYRDGMMTQGFLSADGSLTQDKAEILKDRWRAKFTGIDAAFDVPVLDNGVKFQPLTMKPADAEFLSSRKFATTEIARLFGIPGWMINDQEKSTSWGCLPGDALVLTTSGPVPIEDVRPGDEVWSYSDAGMTPAKVTAWYMTGYKTLLTIKTTARDLRATANHRVPVRRYFGRADGRKRGECGWETVEVAAGEIRVGDYLLVPHGMGDGDRTTAPNGRDLTVEAMEFCGLYLGDGSQDGNRFEIAHEDDPDYMDYYRAVIRAEFGADPYVDGGRANRTRFSSVAARELLECGFTGTAHTKRIPDWVFRLTPDLQLGLLRGLVDSDGCIQRGCIVFSSCNKLLLEDVRHLCMLLGVPAGRVVKSRPGGPGVIRGRAHNSTQKYHLSLSSTPYNEAIGSHSARKANNLITGPTERRLRYDDGWRGGLGESTWPRRLAATPGGMWPHSDVVLQRVTAIETGAVDVPVYDITVDEHAHFVSDGVIVHNTGMEQQFTAFVILTLKPYMQRIEQRITREVLDPRTEKAEFKVEGLLRGDTQARAAFYNAGITGGWLVPNEPRALEDLPPVAWGDRPYLPHNTPAGTDPAAGGDT